MARSATSVRTRPRLAVAAAAVLAFSLVPAGASHAQGANGSASQAGSDAVSAGQTFRINVPLYVNGDYAGDLTAELTLSGRAAAERLRLVDLLEGVASDGVVTQVADYEGAPDFISLEALQAVDLDIAYDASAIALNVVLPVDERAERIVSFAPEFDRAPGEIVEPAGASLGLGVALSQDYYHESATHDPGLDGLRARVRGGANVGGVNGLNLAFENFFDDGAEDADADYWRRGDTVLFKDFTDSAVRLSLGDINPVLTGVQSAPGLGGIGVQRLYNEIQPLQNVRPAGRTQFTLERDSTVEVLLNGVPFRTLRLPAGRYDIRDLPFTSGLNDVVIVVEDETGVRREIAAFSQFLDFDLLSRGISEFELILGAPTTFGDSGNEYGEEVAFTGFYRRGVTDRLTLGVHGQGSDGFGMLGFEGAVSTPIGVAFGEIVASGDEEHGGGYAANAGLTWNAYTPSGQRELSLFAETESADFISLSELSPQNPRVYEVSARARTPLIGRLQLSLAASYAQGREAAPDETRGSVTLSRAFGRANMFVSYEHTDRGGFEEEDDRILASLVYRFGGRQLARARYDSFRDRTSLEWERQLRTQAGDWGARLGVADQEAGPEAIGEVSYFGNRFEANLFHDYISSLDPGAPPEQLTSYDVEVGVGVAGGRVAVGRDASEGFVIVDRHETLGRRRVDIDSRYSTGTTARTDFLGAALMPITAPYQFDEIDFDVDNLPLGYDLGAAQAVIKPGATTGYRITLGSDASNTIVGFLLYESGAPVALEGGRLRAVEGDDEPVLFFTNSAGRFVTQGVASGRYRVEIGGSNEAVAILVVDDSANGLVDVGELVVADR